MRLIAPLVIVCLAAGTATVAPAYGSPGVVSDIAKGGVARSVAPAAARPAAPRAGAAITIGRTNPSNSAGASCGGPIQVIVQESSTAPTTYATPTAGVITSYSHNARAGFTGHLRLLAFTPLGSGTYTQVGKSALNLLTQGVLNTFPTRVPVPAGAVLGLQSDEPNMLCADNAAGLGVIRFDSLANYNPDAVTGNFAGPGTGGYYLNLSAVVEPDVDGDGYGDISQDQCLQSALAHDACPAPDTTLTKTPKKHTTTRKQKIKFTSTIPGSTFTCAVDGKPAAPCTSAFKKKYKLGKHTVVITASSPVGIADPTPAEVKFKVKLPRR